MEYKEVILYPAILENGSTTTTQSTSLQPWTFKEINVAPDDGSVIANFDGVSFEPYVRMFLSGDDIFTNNQYYTNSYDGEQYKLVEMIWKEIEIPFTPSVVFIDGDDSGYYGYLLPKLGIGFATRYVDDPTKNPTNLDAYTFYLDVEITKDGIRFRPDSKIDEPSNGKNFWPYLAGTLNWQNYTYKYTALG